MTRKIEILLVDDEEEYVRTMAERSKIRELGSEVALDGQQALKMLDDDIPDVMVLDLKMQGMDGIATLQRIRKLVASGGERPLREKSIADLMVPESLYFRIYQDQDVREAVEALEGARQRSAAEGNADRGRRTLLVFDRKERFVGLLSAEDIVRILIPPFLLESPYASYFTGMFLAQAKVVGKLPIHDIIRSPLSIEVDAPLVEAAYLLVSRSLSHVPVTSEGEVVGILRPEDLYQEIATLSG